MALKIEFEFNERFEWEQVSRDYTPKKGELVVQAISGPVIRKPMGPGTSTTTFSNDTVIQRWQADRQVASNAMVKEGKNPLSYKSDELLVAEHLQAGIVEENAPGKITSLKVSGGADEKFNKSLENFLKIYFNVSGAKQ